MACLHKFPTTRKAVHYKEGPRASSTHSMGPYLICQWDAECCLEGGRKNIKLGHVSNISQGAHVVWGEEEKKKKFKGQGALRETLIAAAHRCI